MVRARLNSLAFMERSGVKIQCSDWFAKDLLMCCHIFGNGLRQ